MKTAFEKFARNLLCAAAIATSGVIAAPIVAPTLVSQAQAQQPQPYTSNELLNAGHSFFGSTSSGLASLVERAVSSYGLPNGPVRTGVGARLGVNVGYLKVRDEPTWNPF